MSVSCVLRSFLEGASGESASKRMAHAELLLNDRRCARISFLLCSLFCALTFRLARSCCALDMISPQCSLVNVCPSDVNIILPASAVESISISKFVIRSTTAGSGCPY